MKPHDDEDSQFDILREQLKSLERRVDALEHPHAAHRQNSVAAPAIHASPELGMLAAVPAVGRAALGLAGAYLLRALAEAEAVPRLLVIVVGVLYAAGWLFLSLRVREKSTIAATVYDLTSAMILAPLLWEATVRFGILPAVATAAILTAFGGAGSRTPLVASACLIVAAALMVRTGDMVPFAAALLAIAALSRDSLRIPAALAADFAIWLLIYIMTSAPDQRGDYKAVPAPVSLALCAALFVIATAGVAWRTLRQAKPANYFDIAQAALGDGLAIVGTLQLTQWRASLAVGVFCAVLCVACYATRRSLFQWYGAGLGIAAALLLAPGTMLTLILGTAAVVATLFRLPHQGILFLISAAATNSLPQSMVSAFFASSLAPPTASLGILVLAAAGCYFAWGSTPARLSMLCAFLAGLSIAAFAVLAVQPLAHLLAPVRTLTISALALGFAFAGARTGRSELGWIGYFAIGMGALKLLLADFRNSTPTALAMSLICYGALLILLPRLGAKRA